MRGGFDDGSEYDEWRHDGRGRRPFCRLARSSLFLLIIGGAALIVVYLVSGTGRSGAGEGKPGPASSGKSAALIELESRYARGEIDRDEFVEKKQDLA